MKLRRLSFLATAALCALPFLFPAKSTAQTGRSAVWDADNSAKSAAQTGQGTWHQAPWSQHEDKKKEKTVGTVKIPGGGSVKINGKTAGDGAKLKCGDTIETGNDPVDIALEGGKEYTVDPGTKVKITCSPNGAVALLVIYGGIHPVGGDADYLQPLPWLAAFANGNSSFPSIGGVGGKTISTVLPTGQVIFTTVSN